MSLSRLASASLLASLASALPNLAIAAEGPDHPVVAGFERFFAGPGDDARGGRLLLGELNCTSCHKAEGGLASQVLPKAAPILDAVGQRVRAGYIRAILDGPHAAKPGTTMPDVLGALPAEKKAEAAEAIAHLLASTGRTRGGKVDRRSIERGREIYRQVGCVACHAPEDPKSPAGGLATTVPLGPLAEKYTVSGLATFLIEPHKARPSGRMPGLGLNSRDARDVAQFLLRDLAREIPPSLKYRYYEGEWEKLPDFSTMEPAASGEVSGLDIAVARRGDNFGIRFEGYLRIEDGADYHFHLSSDDGSILRIDDKVLIENDGIHPDQSVTAKVPLGLGLHKISVDYFNGSGEKTLALEFDGGGLRTQSVEPYLVISDAPPPPSDPKSGDSIQVDPALVEKGRSLFASVGCASCHRLEKGGPALESTLMAPPLARLKPGSGCLAPKPAAGLPDYHLNDRQRAALGASLAEFADHPPAPIDPKASIARTMLAFNCYACHRRDGVGGVEDERNPYFETTQKEIGDEGRIPPHADGAGAKLKEEYLDHIFADGAKDRPYMKTQMPRFGKENVGHLSGELARVDALPDAGPVPDLGIPERKAKAQGRFLVGTRAFGCVNCHNFGGEASRGIPALDMAIMTRRLNHDWFVRYVVDPAAYRPGTRMPSAWPKDSEKSQILDVLDGEPRNQVEAVWLYLSDGIRAQKPYGIGTEPIPLAAENGEATLYRNFIEGSGPRAIGVGYPEKANLAFDANGLRLALLWQGAFMDASRHWSGRGEGYQPPLGDDILRLPPGPTLAFLDKPESPWPDRVEKGSDARFRGYSLSKDRRPTFLYDLGPVRVEDFPDAVAAEGKQSAGLKRVVSLSAPAPTPNLYYRAASGSKIEPAEGGWYLIDGEWKTKLDSAAPPLVRSSAGRKELLVPIGLAGGKERVTQIYAW